jgi:hypothetical protein
MFESDVLVCPADNDSELPTYFTNICDTGVLECPDEYITATRPSGSSTTRKRSTHLHKHRNDPVHRHAVSHADSHVDRHTSEATDGSTESRRRLIARDPDGASGSTRPYNRGQCQQRGNDNKPGLSYNSYSYPVGDDWEGDEEMFDNGYDTVDPTQCTDGSVKGHVLPTSPYPRWFAVEHVMELQTFQIFTRDLAANIMPDGSPSGRDQVYCDFMKTLFTRSLPANVPPAAGCTTVETKPINRIMQVHGNLENWKNFHLLEEEINTMKGR